MSFHPHVPVGVFDPHTERKISSTLKENRTQFIEVAFDVVPLVLAAAQMEDESVIATWIEFATKVGTVNWPDVIREMLSSLPALSGPGPQPPSPDDLLGVISNTFQPGACLPVYATDEFHELVHNLHDATHVDSADIHNALNEVLAARGFRTFPSKDKVVVSAMTSTNEFASFLDGNTLAALQAALGGK
eukprot:TRINITY_DN75278_c0_g1_i1.p1 TRINITY_DN75278_c0_g1~~TRINITY_DN75278_c0_g1_i1.p1  ORF type:complete len:189 (-),score=2.95 TRINITY_DN75278_c0_g1_i1:82-648(-)